MNFQSLVRKINKLDYKKYFYQNGLDKIFKKEKIDFKKKNFKFDYIFKNNNKKAYPPEILDLIRLHFLIRLRKITTILELGTGYSTLVMAHALSMNKRDYKQYVNKNLRRGNAFELHSVDTSKKFIRMSNNRIPKNLKKTVFTYHSDAKMTKFSGQICASFNKIPNICPDFIYVDGPSFMHVKGSIKGVHTRHLDRTIISSDLLEIESFLLPGTLILWDGLTSYARFVEKNFKRKWIFKHLKSGDITIAEQVEEALGVYNKKQIKFCLGRD